STYPSPTCSRATSPSIHSSCSASNSKPRDGSGGQAKPALTRDGRRVDSCWPSLCPLTRSIFGPVSPVELHAVLGRERVHFGEGAAGVFGHSPGVEQLHGPGASVIAA